jgi:hypothetical protein
VPGDDLHVEEVVEDVAEQACEQRDRAHCDDGREPAAAARCLCVPPRPEAAESQDERGHPERPERREIDDQAAEEAEHGAGNRAAQEPERDDDDEQQVGRASADHHRRHDDDLQHGDDEYERKRPRPVRGGHRTRSLGTRTITASSEPKST